MITGNKDAIAATKFILAHAPDNPVWGQGRRWALEQRLLAITKPTCARAPDPFTLPTVPYKYDVKNQMWQWGVNPIQMIAIMDQWMRMTEDQRKATNFLASQVKPTKKLDFWKTFARTQSYAWEEDFAKIARLELVDIRPFLKKFPPNYRKLIKAHSPKIHFLELLIFLH